MDKELKTRVSDMILSYTNTLEDLNIKEMILYSLKGGKCLRSIICLFLLDYFGIIEERLVVAIELLHSASLILDDLPCMDNDDYRRNCLSFHKKYGIKNAYLVSTFILSEYNKIIYNLGNKIVFEYSLINISKIILGQYSDLYNVIDLKKIKSENELQRRIYENNLKTTPFFINSFIIPFFLSSIQFNIKDIEDMALCFSTAFQIYDDFIDLENDKEKGSFNNVNILGKDRSYELYKQNINKFYILLYKYKINKKLFVNIFSYLNSKLEGYI